MVHFTSLRNAKKKRWIAFGINNHINESSIAAFLQSEQLCIFLTIFHAWNFNSTCWWLLRTGSWGSGCKKKTRLWFKIGIPRRNVGDVSPKISQSNGIILGNTHRVRTVYLGESGRALGQRKGSNKQCLLCPICSCAWQKFPEPEGEQGTGGIKGIWLRLSFLDPWNRKRSIAFLRVFAIVSGSGSRTWTCHCSASNQQTRDSSGSETHSEHRNATGSGLRWRTTSCSAGFTTLHTGARSKVSEQWKFVAVLSSQSS